MPIDDLKSALQRRRETARILFDQSLIARHADADLRLRAAFDSDDSMGEAPAVTTARLEVEAIQREIADAEIVFEFEGIGRQRWLALINAYPPTPEQRATAPGLEYDADMFPAALLSATCVSRVLSVDDALWMARELDEAEWSKLWNAALAACLGRADRPKSEAATALRRMAARWSTTAPHEASPDPSS